MKYKYNNEWNTITKDGAPGQNGKSAYEYAKQGGYTGTEEEFAEKLAEEIDVSGFMNKTNPTGTGSFSLNRKAGSTIGNYSHAEGKSNTASGECSHAEGQITKASGECSHAEGYKTEARIGFASHAEGNGTIASGNNSHAEGSGTAASGISSHAEGSGTRAGTKAFSVTSFDEASLTFTLSSVDGLAVGQYYSLYLDGSGTLDCGNITTIDADNKTITVNRAPNAAKHAKHLSIYDSPDLGDTYIGAVSHAEGQNTHALGEASHAEGCDSATFGDYSHAEGFDTGAYGVYSHAEGSSTEASGITSHAEGGGTTASGDRSHAEGASTVASGEASHAEGIDTKASGNSSHVQGKYNIEDSFNVYADIIGNGTSSKRSNAATVDWSGNAWYAGDVYVGSTSGVNKDEGSKKLATEEYVDKSVIVPAPSPADEEKVLRVVGGKATWVSLPSASGVSF